MSKSGDWLIDRAIKKAAINPMRIEIDEDQLGSGLIHRARRTGHFAAARKFGQFWKIETASDLAPDCLPAEDSHLYLICAPFLQRETTRIAIGSMEIKTPEARPHLAWIWLHPHFRRTIAGQNFATDALKSVSLNYPVLEMNESGSVVSKQRRIKLWNRAFLES
ncbi:hypothetical protein CQ018_12330 [Arthrobacter sp. MYb227]|uniref:hypothetical protein n=1 Tax=Arthrobacter sp. MYb227 TaxID=1848601 RepID=UPI000CFACF3C|nr:hypothetical protein [Arthrobacter sp. MYb227]PQZ92284.1 hypothetical protein CQ018_12330 [Arthrobacter sp. MYb227]